MIKKLLPLLMLLMGVGAGVGAGIMLKPEPDPEALAEQTKRAEEMKKDAVEEELAATRDYVKLSNQFVVPIVRNDRVSSMIVMSRSVEVEMGQKEFVYSKEPKLRDSFLRVLFDHANMGGFKGEFTNANTLDVLRMSLLEVAQRDIGELITDVLIIEIARQDL